MAHPVYIWKKKKNKSRQKFGSKIKATSRRREEIEQKKELLFRGLKGL